MIDRGALVLGPSPVAASYRGVHRPPLDAQAFTGRRGRELARRYADAVVAGDGVIEDLDDAITLRGEATAMGIAGLDVVVFELPQEPAPRPGAVPIAFEPPAEGLRLLGYDVIESLRALRLAPRRRRPPARRQRRRAPREARGRRGPRGRAQRPRRRRRAASSPCASGCSAPS